MNRKGWCPADMSKSLFCAHSPIASPVRQKHISFADIAAITIIE